MGIPNIICSTIAINHLERLVSEMNHYVLTRVGLLNSTKCRVYGYLGSLYKQKRSPIGLNPVHTTYGAYKQECDNARQIYSGFQNR